MFVIRNKLRPWLHLLARTPFTCSNYCVIRMAMVLDYEYFITALHLCGIHAIKNATDVVPIRY